MIYRNGDEVYLSDGYTGKILTTFITPSYTIFNIERADGSVRKYGRSQIIGPINPSKDDLIDVLKDGIEHIICCEGDEEQMLEIANNLDFYIKNFDGGRY